MKTIDQLKPNEKNPRKISDEKLQMLKKSLEEFGDLSGIVYNRKLKRLVGGHQRAKTLPKDAEIVIERNYSTPTISGTVAEGYIKLGTERISYREVEWDDAKDLAANLAANKHGGEFDLPKLTDLLKELDELDYDMELTGFEDDEIDKLILTEINESEELKEDGGSTEYCPHCGEEI